MTVLVANDEIFMSSSLKGAAYTVWKSLQLCMLAWAETTGVTDKCHKNEGSCGEVMVASQYYTEHYVSRTNSKADLANSN